MASTKERQRKLARARAERRLRALAAKQRRKRQRLAAVGASIGLIVVILGATWLLGGFSPDEPSAPTVAQGTCSWVLKDPAADPNLVDTGHPDTEGAPRTGTQTMTLKTSLGDIEASIDLSRAPCTASSFTYLSSRNFFDDTKCTLLSDDLKVLKCGDPTGNGAGGPSYTFADEDKPDTPVANASTAPSPSPSAERQVYYHKGQIVMVNTGANTNGSQFYIITADDSPLSPAYSIVGAVTKGMDIVDSVVKEGAVDEAGKAVAEGKPKKEITIQQLVMGDPVQATPSPTAAASPPPSAPPPSTPPPSTPAA